MDLPEQAEPAAYAAREAKRLVTSPHDPNYYDRFYINIEQKGYYIWGQSGSRQVQP